MLLMAAGGQLENGDVCEGVAAAVGMAGCCVSRQACPVGGETRRARPSGGCKAEDFILYHYLRRRCVRR